MALVIPFTSDNPITKLSTTLAGTQYRFRARWNSRDAAWYLDIYDDTNVSIGSGIKVVLGTFLGRQFNHPLFRDGALVAVDLSGSGRDATIDDFGSRVLVMWITAAEILSLRITVDFPDPGA